MAALTSSTAASSSSTRDPRLDGPFGGANQSGLIRYASGIAGGYNPNASAGNTAPTQDDPVAKIRDQYGQALGFKPDGTFDPNYQNPSNIPFIDVTKAGDDPAQTQADITRAKFDDLQGRFIPVEDALIDSVTDVSKINSNAVAAGERYQARLDRFDDVQDRNLARQGRQLTGEEQEALDRRTSLQGALDRTALQNVTRRTELDRNLEVIDQLNRLGRGLSANAASSLSNAAANQTARERAQQQIDASKPSPLSGVISGGLTGFAATGNPIGAAAGAGLGLLGSLF